MFVKQSQDYDKVRNLQTTTREIVRCRVILIRASAPTHITQDCQSNKLPIPEQGGVIGPCYLTVCCQGHIIQQQEQAKHTSTAATSAALRWWKQHGVIFTL